MEPINQSEDIILNHVAAAMAAAVIPVPLADVAAVTWVQIDLVNKLADRYRVECDPIRGRAAVLSLAGAGLARLGASLVKSVPGVGTLLGGATQAVLSGASTYALGEVYKEHFETRGSLEDVDFDALRERYRDAVERGREIARTLHRAVGLDEEEPDAVAETLERLARLRRSGVLTEEEFAKLTEPPIEAA